VLHKRLPSSQSVDVRSAGPVIFASFGMQRGRGSKKRGNLRKLDDDIATGQFRVPTTVTMPKDIVGFPDRLITCLAYSESFSYSGSATPAAQVFSINSAFDPDATGSGHQPSFYDALTAIYTRYFVRQFRVDIFVDNHTTTSGVYGVLCYSDQDISGNTVEQLAESKYSKLFLLPASTGGTNARKVKLPWMTTSQIMGEPYAEADNYMYAAYNANPTDLCYAIMKFSADDGTTAISLSVRALIYMEIIFKDLLPQKSSLLKFKVPPKDREDEDAPSTATVVAKRSQSLAKKK